MDRCLTPFRVLPTDLDMAVHVNNGVYFSLCDLARMDFMIRAGTYQRLVQRRWFPVVVSETVQFHRALMPFERFFIETQLIGWDERTFFMQHRVFCHRPDGELAAEVLARGVMVRRAGGTVSVPELLAAVGDPARPEPMSPWIMDWACAMDANRERYKREAARY
jgi:acyl-CoA thioesterase FadM